MVASSTAGKMREATRPTARTLSHSDRYRVQHRTRHANCDRAGRRRFLVQLAKGPPRELDVPAQLTDRALINRPCPVPSQ
jgi:hypothetical protein